MLTPKRFTIEEAQKVCAEVMQQGRCFYLDEKPKQIRIGGEWIYIGAIRWWASARHGVPPIDLTPEDRENWV